MAKDLFDQVADEARPPAVLGRYPGISDYTGDLLLDDLVNSGAWLDLELKRPYLIILIGMILSLVLLRGMCGNSRPWTR